MKNFTLLVSVVAVYFLGAFCVDAQVVTKTVDDGTDGTLRIEIADAGTGGTVTFDPSIQGQTINVTMGAIPINAFAAITIDGNNGGTPTTISSGSNSRIFDVDATIAAVINFDSVIFRDGSAENGGAILASGATTVVNITDCEFRSNIATGAAATNGGGAIWNNGATINISATTFESNIASGTSGSGGAILNSNGGNLSITDAMFRTNTSNRAGGAIEDNASATTVITVDNTSFISNDAGTNPGNGGALHVSGSSSYTFDGGVVRENIAGKEGGGLWNNLGTLTINGTIIEDNVAQGDFVAGTPPQIVGGGGIFAEDGTGVVVINEGTIIRRNQATGVQGSGGGILMATGTTLTINGTVANPVMIMDNQASRAGGGIEDWSLETNSNTITNVEFSGNSAGLDGTNFTANGGPGNGGAIHVTGPGSNTITGGTATANLAANEGGAFWNGTGTMTVDGTSITNNTASGAGAANGGGGLFNLGGTLDISNAIIDGNAASGTAGSGGGILNTRGGTLNVTSSLITNNTAVRAGGGIEDNSTIDVSGSVPVGSISLDGVNLDSNNTSASPGNGGGMHLTGAATSTITGGTVNNNTASNEGGGLWNGSGTMTVSGVQIDSNIAVGNDTSSPGAAGGGGIYNEGGTVNLTNNTVVSNNQATGVQSTGGGVLNAAGTFTATDSEISGNESNRAGGGIETNGDSSIELTNTNLDGNFTGVVTGSGAPGNGGGLHVSGSAPVTITGGTVNNNIAAKEGGGLWNNGGALTINGTTISGNDARGDFVAGTPPEIVGGGGIFSEDSMTGRVIINEGTTIDNNVATGVQGSGGGILMATGTTLTINGTEANPVTISNNKASRAGGGLEDWSLDANINTITNVNFTNNSVGLDGMNFTANGGPGNGGAIHVTGPGDNTIIGGTASDNTAANEGGGFWNGSGTMTVDGTLIDQNTASGNDETVPGAAGGGGIFNEGGTVNMVNGAVVSNNVADGAQSTGGGVLNAAGVFTATDSEISGNESNRAGGGIETNGDSSVELTNTNLNGNLTGATTGPGAPGNGGGLHVSGAAPVTITGGTVNNNIARKEGGGLWNNGGLLTINGTTLSGNDAQGDFVAGMPPEIVGGGAIFSEDSMTGTVVINEGTIIDGNVATGVQGSGGGILMATGTTLSINGTVTNPVVISNNSASRAGGGIEDWSLGATTATITNTNFSGNTAGISVGTFTANGGPGNGGAIHVTGPGIVEITAGTADSNSAALEGGAFWNNVGTMSISDVDITNNTSTGAGADDGGAALFNNGGTLNVSDSFIDGNLATGASGSGGALLSTTGAVTITNTTITNNAANRAGGAIELIDGTLDISGSEISNNDVDGTAGTAAPGNGGALHISGSSVVNIDSSIMNSNSAAAEGGALWNQLNSVLVVSNSTLDGNSANGTAVDNGGGAIFNNGGDTEVYDTTISNNTSVSNGGGISNQVGSLIVETSTISSNTASLDGAGVYHAGTNALFDIVTVARNIATGNGGGLASVAGTFSITNTLVAENQAASDFNVSGITSNDYNLIEIDDTNSFTAMPNDIVGTVASPEFASLGPLQDNGGNTFTHAILDGTRAQDQGNPNNNLTDQRGEAVFGPARDIGSFEAQQTLSNDDIAAALAAVRLYPNPSSDGRFNIQLPAQVTSTATYRITDMTGKVVGGSSLRTGVNNLQMKNLSAGIYIVQVIAADQSQSLKLIIE
ncbi:beta strand repeat-containing protein [Nonlabens agnitus]|uniref:Secretion system C-terminal sorting domain-containing protein n=1 Tax=Nonlabens agnitus TaxID=870484 RepID=A0A2S9WSC1_9FLAO|nr:T9SS type A sorting domain-containing protein [Nonlabens agnitus]PRP66384.1 hypothetical protein BST86_04405 [Nonlabens agnitus]